MGSELDLLQQKLESRLQSFDGLLVAYSGGTDSAYLAWQAYQVLGERMLAVIADSPSLPRRHLAEAIAFAHDHGIPLRVVQTNEMQRPEYLRNDEKRCFFCKDELFRVLDQVATETGLQMVAYGRNRDDDGDYRPGQQAAKFHGAVAPLAEAGMGKQDVRALARRAGLTLWDKPASACLSSRLAYGQAVSAEALRQVEQAEDHLSSLGFHQFRVRHHGDIARIEIERSELECALTLTMLDRITEGVRSAGFSFVTLDTEGYRSGSLNALLPVEVLSAKR